MEAGHRSQHTVRQAGHRPAHARAFLALVLASIPLSWSTACRVDPPVREVQCGMDEAAVPRMADPCLDGIQAFGPVRFARARGAPTTETRAFVTTRPGTACLRVVNGAGRGTRVSAATIALDGNPIVGTSSFNQNVGLVSKRFPLSSAEHRLSVELRSAPGSWIEVEISYAPDVSPAELASQTEIARLRRLACREFNSVLSTLGPDKADQEVGALARSGIAPGQMRVRLNGYGVPRRLGPLPTEEVGVEPGDDAVAVARKWLVAHDALFRTPAPSVDWRVVHSKPLPAGGILVRFREYAGGLPVDGSLAAIAVSAEKSVRTFAGNVVPADALPTGRTPLVDIDQAVATACQEAGADPCPAAPAAELVIVDPYLLPNATGSRARLAWRIDLMVPSLDMTRSYWVDADSGALLGAQDGGQAQEIRLDRMTAFDNTTDPLLITSEVVFDTTTGYVEGCRAPGNRPWCDMLTICLLATHAEWGRLGRAGWSGLGLQRADGTVVIPADDGYRVLFTSLPMGFVGFWAHPIPNWEVVSGAAEPLRWPWVILREPSGLHCDTVREEFAHGYYDVETANLERGLRGDYFSCLSEHVGDFWPSIMGSAPERVDEAFHAYLASLVGGEISETVVENHASLSSPHSCAEFRTDCPLRVNEFRHIDYLDERWRSAVFPEGTTLAGEPCGSPYPNSSIPTHVAYLLARESPGVIHNGVWTEPLGYDLTAWFFNEMYVGTAQVSDDFLDFADNFRETYHRLGEKCVSDSPPETCLPDKDEIDLSARALRAVGFWSQPIDVSGLRPPEDPLFAVNSTPVAVATRAGVDVFYVNWTPGGPGVPERHDLVTVRLIDPLDTRLTPVQANLTAGMPDPYLFFEPAVAVHDGRVMVAYVPGPMPNNIVLREYDGGSFVGAPTVFSFVDTRHTIAMASFAGRLFLVYQDSSTFALRYFTSSDSASQPIVDPASDDPAGAMPVLVADEERGLYLFYRAVSEEAPAGSGRYAMFVRRWNSAGTGFGPATRLQIADSAVCPMIHGDTGLPFDLTRVPGYSRTRGGPTVAVHNGRFQVFYPTSEYTSFKHTSLRVPAPGTADPVPENSGARQTTLEAQGLFRAWPVVVESTLAGRVLSLFWAGSIGGSTGDSLLMLWKESD